MKRILLPAGLAVVFLASGAVFAVDFFGGPANKAAGGGGGGSAADTAAQILTKLLTVDGPTSGISAQTTAEVVGSGSTTIAVDLATAEAAGTLPEANGGTGQTTMAAAGICMEAGGSACNITQGTIDYAASIEADFAAQSIGIVTLTGVLTITTANLAAGRSFTLAIVGDGSERALTLPAWKFVGAAAPATIAASKTGILSLLSIGTTDGAVVAAWAVQP